MERIYTIPLRKEFQKAPKYKYTSKAVRALKKFVTKHTKSENVKIGKYLNEKLWKNGPKNPPSKVKVNITKDKENITHVELIDAPTKKREEVDAPTAKEAKVEKKDSKVPTAKETKIEKKDSKVPTAKELVDKKNSKK